MGGACKESSQAPMPIAVSKEFAPRNEAVTSLISEEYKQMHEHLREHEKAISTLTIVMITASATLLSAVGILYLRFHSAGQRDIGLTFSYLFLSPPILVIPLMAAIRGHRASLYKMGIYIKVFLEGEETGANWHRRLERYQLHIRGDSQDSVPYFAWVISAISYVLFTFSLSEIQAASLAHYFLAAVVLVPLLAMQHYRHNKVKRIEDIERIWRIVRDEEELRGGA